MPSQAATAHPHVATAPIHTAPAHATATPSRPTHCPTPPPTLIPLTPICPTPTLATPVHSMPTYPTPIYYPYFRYVTPIPTAPGPNLQAPQKPEQPLLVPTSVAGSPGTLRPLAHPVAIHTPYVPAPEEDKPALQNMMVEPAALTQQPRPGTDRICEANVGSENATTPRPRLEDRSGSAPEDTPQRKESSVASGISAATWNTLLRVAGCMGLMAVCGGVGLISCQLFAAGGRNHGKAARVAS